MSLQVNQTRTDCIWAALQAVRGRPIAMGDNFTISPGGYVDSPLGQHIADYRRQGVQNKFI